MTLSARSALTAGEVTQLTAASTSLIDCSAAWAVSAALTPAFFCAGGVYKWVGERVEFFREPVGIR